MSDRHTRGTGRDREGDGGRRRDREEVGGSGREREGKGEGGTGSEKVRPTYRANVKWGGELHDVFGDRAT